MCIYIKVYLVFGDEFHRSWLQYQVVAFRQIADSGYWHWKARGNLLGAVYVYAYSILDWFATLFGDP